MLYFKGDFFNKPRASLARAAFKSDFPRKKNCVGIPYVLSKKIKGISSLKLKVSSIYGENGGKSD